MPERSLLLGLGALALLAACNTQPQPQSQGEPSPAVAEPSPPPPERYELSIDAPGMSIELLEHEVVPVIERAMLGIPGMRDVVAETSAERVRIELAVERGHADMATLHAELDALANKLPPELARPLLQRREGVDAPFVRWALEGETLDMNLLARLHAQLLAHSTALAGVTHWQSCTPQRRVLIELDAALVHALRTSVVDIEHTLRSQLLELPRDVSIEDLRDIVLREAPQPIRVADVAALRYGFGPPRCVAAGTRGLAASATLTLADEAARERVTQALDSFTLPPGVSLRRFSGADTIVELVVDPTLPLEQVAETIGRGFARESSPWLLEVGVEADACMHAGTRVRLSLSGRARAGADSLASFRSIPGVTHVSVAETPESSLRHVWLHGPDAAALRERATQLQSSAGLEVFAYLGPLLPDIEIRPDLRRMAELGFSMSAFAMQLSLARAGVEVGVLHDALGALPVWLRLGDSDGSLAQLRELALQVGDQQLTLTELAQLSTLAAPTRSCRHAGRPAVLLALRGDARAAWSHVVAELPDNFAVTDIE